MRVVSTGALGRVSMGVVSVERGSRSGAISVERGSRSGGSRRVGLAVCSSVVVGGRGRLGGSVGRVLVGALEVVFGPTSSSGDELSGLGGRSTGLERGGVFWSTVPCISAGCLALNG